MFYKINEKFSIRKTKLAVGSILIASTFAITTTPSIVGLNSNNIVYAADSALQPNNGDLSTITATPTDTSIKFALKDNVSYSGMKIPLKIKGVRQSYNEQHQKIHMRDTTTDKVYEIGSVKIVSETNGKAIKDLETNFRNNYVNLNTYTPNDFINYLNERMKLEESNEITYEITLNSNVDKLNSKREFNFLERHNNERTKIDNPLRDLNVYANNPATELENKITSIKNKGNINNFYYNGNLIKTTNDNHITPASFIEVVDDKDIRETGVSLGIGSQSNPYTPTKDSVNFIDRIAHNSSISFQFLYGTVFNQDYKLAPGDLKLVISHNNKFQEVKSELPSEVTLNALVASVTSRSTEISEDKSMIKINKKNLSGNYSDVKMKVTKDDNGNIILTNTEPLEYKKGTPSPTYKIKSSELFKIKDNYEYDLNLDDLVTEENIDVTVNFLNYSKTNNLSNNKIILKNLGIGESTTGSLIIKYIDENGNEIKQPKTVLNNQLWNTPYEIKPTEETISGYKYLRVQNGDQALKGYAMVGTREIKLVYHKIQTTYVADDTKDFGTETSKTLENGDVVITKGTKPKVVENNVPFETVTRDNPKLPIGTTKVVTEGVAGRTKTTTTYTVDKTTGKVTTNTPKTEVLVPKVDKVVERGTGANAPTPFNVVYEADPSLPNGENKVQVTGKDGVKDVTGKVLTQPTTQVVKVGTKPTVVERDIPFETITKENSKLPEGSSKVVTEGVVGKTKTTTTYTVDPQTGKVTASEPKTETVVAKVDKVVELGVGANVPVPFETTYEADPELQNGETKITTPGKDGLKDVTGKVLTEPVTQVITVGTKSTVTEAEIPFETITNENPESPVGTETVITEGVVGKTQTTITYTLNPETGELTASEPTTEVLVEKVDKVVEVGTGENEVIPFETVYEDDPTLPKGEEKEVTPGVNGEKDVTGKVIKEPQARVVKRGTKEVVAEKPKSEVPTTEAPKVTTPSNNASTQTPAPTAQKAVTTPKTSTGVDAGVIGAISVSLISGLSVLGIKKRRKDK